jgi:hypothetical protein
MRKRRHLGARTLVVLVLSAAPAVSLAQNGPAVRPSVSVIELFDSNVFSTPSARQQDVVTRLTSGLESEHRSAVLTLAGSYSFDAERFSTHETLSSVNARQHGALTASYQPSPRLTLGTDVQMWTTHTPAELSAQTGLTFGRASARRESAEGRIVRQLTPVATGRVTVGVTHDRLGGLDAETSTVSVAGERALSVRDKIRSSYGFAHYLFGTSAAVTAHTATAGISHMVTRRLSLSVDAGPRAIGSEVTPEVAASISYLGRAASFSTAYTHTRTTIIGQTGTAETRSLTATAAWTMGRSLHLRVEPGFFQNELAGRRLDALGLSTGVERPLGRGLSIELSLAGQVQQGALAGGIPTPISRYCTQVRLVAVPLDKALPGRRR